MTGNMIAKHIVVGQSINGVISLHTPVQVNKLAAGDIVYVAGSDGVMPQWYRVYDDGQRLRFWAVSNQFAEAVASMPTAEENVTEEEIEAEAPYMAGFAGNGWGL